MGARGPRTPFDKSAPPFLGAQTNVGRWVLDGGADADRPAAQRRCDDDGGGVGRLPQRHACRLCRGRGEAKKIQKLYGAASIDARPDPVFGLLSGVPPADILHFAVHGRYDPLGAGDGIWLVEGPADRSRARSAGSDLSSRAPFVFLNACQVGSGQELLGSYGGIAQAFLQVGASAVRGAAVVDRRRDRPAHRARVLPPGARADGPMRRRRTAEAPAAAGRRSDPARNGPPAVADLLRRARQPGSSRTRPRNRRRISRTSSTAIRRSGCRGTGSDAKGGHHDG